MSGGTGSSVVFDLAALTAEVCNPGRGRLEPVANLFHVNVEISKYFSNASKGMDAFALCCDLGGVVSLSIGNILFCISGVDWDSRNIEALYRVVAINESFAVVNLAEKQIGTIDAKYLKTGIIPRSELGDIVIVNAFGFINLKGILDAFDDPHTLVPFMVSPSVSNSSIVVPISNAGGASAFSQSLVTFKHAERLAALVALRRVVGEDANALASIVNPASPDLTGFQARSFLRESLPAAWFQNGTIPAVEESNNLLALLKLSFFSGDESKLVEKQEFSRNYLLVKNFAKRGEINCISDLQLAINNIILFLHILSNLNPSLQKDRWAKNFESSYR